MQKAIPLLQSARKCTSLALPYTKSYSKNCEIILLDRILRFSNMHTRILAFSSVLEEFLKGTPLIFYTFSETDRNKEIYYYVWNNENRKKTKMRCVWNPTGSK